ncbi:MAG: hypothetical protein HC808_00970 [Candidatus Competibacteraceae bacterium]|nr:hypothetical protein [Candidatus Competibacteraceae bacterium]
MADAICLGELIIDFVPTVTGTDLLEAPAFKKAPGGAPGNVAVGLVRLGVKSAFMGKVGDDAFGHFLAKTLRDAGVDVSPLRFSKEARTALAFVSLRADGDRDFMFYRHPSADMLFTPEEVDGEAISKAKLLHFGSISLISEPSRSATLHAVEIAQDQGCLISYDPNLRLPLWPDAGLWHLSPGQLFLLGCWGGFWFMAGELPNSFCKRRLGSRARATPAHGGLAPALSRARSARLRSWRCSSRSAWWCRSTGSPGCGCWRSARRCTWRSARRSI